MLVIQHGSELEDLQILIADVLDSGNDPHIGRGRDLAGWSRERNLETASGANRGLGVSTDDRKAKSDQRQREHDDVKKFKARRIED